MKKTIKKPKLKFIGVHIEESDYKTLCERAEANDRSLSKEVARIIRDTLSPLNPNNN